MRTFTRIHVGLFIGVLLALSGASRDGLATGVLVGTRTHVEVLDRKLLYLRTDTGDTLIESVELEAPPGRFAWIRALPAAPSRIDRASSRLFDVLEEETAVLAPFREEVNARKFGPSILGFIFRETPTKDTDEVEALSESSLPFAVENVHTFSGETTTSTITRRKSLPEDFEDWLSAENLVLSPLQFNILAKQFDQGSTIAVTVYENPRGAERVWLGPARYDFKGTPGLIPTQSIGPSLSRKRQFRLYTLAPVPLLPDIEVEWSRRPWDESTRLASASDRYAVHFSQPIELGSRLAIEGELGSPIPEDHHLVSGVARLDIVPQRDIVMSQAEVEETPRLPGSSQRGSILDLLLVSILGLLPLLYTPESWLLLWVRGRAKEARRHDENAPTWGLLLWPLYCIAVALYFLASLGDGARTAALLPLLIAVVQLATPAPDREREFFYRFRPKKPATPKKSMAPGRSGDVRKTGDLRLSQGVKKTGDLRPSQGAPRASAPPKSGSVPPGSRGDQ